MGRILIADDHDSLRRGLARALAEAGHDVEEGLVQAGDRGIAVRGLVRLVAGLGKGPCQPPPQRVVVVRNQNSSHASPSRATAATALPS